MYRAFIYTFVMYVYKCVSIYIYDVLVSMHSILLCGLTAVAALLRASRASLTRVSSGKLQIECESVHTPEKGRRELVARSRRACFSWSCPLLSCSRRCCCSAFLALAVYRQTPQEQQTLHCSFSRIFVEWARDSPSERPTQSPQPSRPQ